MNSVTSSIIKCILLIFTAAGILFLLDMCIVNSNKNSDWPVIYNDEQLESMKKLTAEMQQIIINRKKLLEERQNYTHFRNERIKMKNEIKERRIKYKNELREQFKNMNNGTKRYVRLRRFNNTMIMLKDQESKSLNDTSALNAKVESEVEDMGVKIDLDKKIKHFHYIII